MWNFVYVEVYHRNTHAGVFTAIFTVKPGGYLHHSISLRPLAFLSSQNALIAVKACMGSKTLYSSKILQF